MKRKWSKGDKIGWSIAGMVLVVLMGIRLAGPKDPPYVPSATTTTTMIQSHGCNPDYEDCTPDDYYNVP